MDATFNLGVKARGRLDINRDSEVLNQFVRINLDEPEIINVGDQKDPLKGLGPYKADPVTILKSLTRKIKDEKSEEKKLQFQQPLQQQEPSQDQEGEEQQAETEETQQPTTPREGKPKPKIGQKQLKEELRRRRKKRRRPKPEEIYTDKDRAAAVNMGSRDIKHSLRMKRKQDRSRIMQIPEEAEPSTFLALGNCEMTRGDPAVALLFFEKALELNPAEKNSLVARSKCYLLLGQPENGLKDAEAAIAVDKNFMKAIYQKAEALYYLGDFEHSLMYYHRGLRIRPEHEGFQLGVHKAQKAIENAIGGAFPGVKRTPAVSSTGKCSSSKSRTTTTSSKVTSSLKNTPEPKTITSTEKSSQRNTPMPRPKTSTPGNKGSKLLRELKPDKEYLDNLLNHPDLKCKNKDDDSEIVGYIQEAVNFLNTRQEFWRQQLPNTCK